MKIHIWQTIFRNEFLIVDYYHKPNQRTIVILQYAHPQQTDSKEHNIMLGAWVPTTYPLPWPQKNDKTVATQRNIIKVDLFMAYQYYIIFLFLGKCRNLKFGTRQT